jgi:hypothetical protein
MAHKVEHVVESYLMVTLDEIASLIDEDLPENYHLKIRQLKHDGTHGPLMKLDDNAVLKIEIVDEDKLSGIEVLKRNAYALSKVKCTDLGKKGQERITLVEGVV